MGEFSNKGHRERLREKYKNGGYKGFLDYEIIEFLLTYAIDRRDVKPVAKELLSKFQSIENILKADSFELMKIEGIGNSTSLFLNLIGDIATKIYEDKIIDKDITTIGSKADLLSYLRGNIAFNAAEQFMVMYLDTRNHIIINEVLFKGTIDKSTIYPREILANIFRYGAKSIIFAHNHPSGNEDPSKKDVDFTAKVYNILNEFDIKLIDHIIITKDSYFSFLECGLLK
ncbi:MAG: DNA repair protein RadC [Fusobacteriaceae bacterium]|nr:DNA repair protein RadC [Fusobacteriaceae bacterium]